MQSYFSLEFNTGYQNGDTHYITLQYVRFRIKRPLVRPDCFVCAMHKVNTLRSAILSTAVNGIVA